MHFEFFGSSMLPTLKPGDCLLVESVDRIRVGDIVVFPLRGKHHVVHRVVSLKLWGVITRGDNNKTNDLWVVQPAEIIGKLLSVHRGTRDIAIVGGTPGILYARILWTLKYFTIIFARLLSPAYYWLSRTGICRLVLPESAKPRLVSFNSQDGVERQLLLGRLVIGRRMPRWDKWQLRPPFRLIVDESMLP